jgi:hypothetical protein
MNCRETVRGPSLHITKTVPIVPEVPIVPIARLGRSPVLPMRGFLGLKPAKS